MSIEIVLLLLPELMLIALATLIYLAGAFLRARGGWGWGAVAGLALAAVALYQQTPVAQTPLVGAVTTVESVGPLALDARGGTDHLAIYARWLALVAGLVLVLTASRPGQDVQEPEFVGTLLLAVSGTMLVAGARELVLLFLGLEMVSIPTYVLLYLGRRDAASPEAAVKYFFLSILSSALTLYGFSFLYGAAGSTQLARLSTALTNAAVQPAPREAFAAVGLVFVFAGLGFKIAAVPFHFYAPDVYQGTTNGNAGVLAVLPKIAGIVALTRIVAAATQGMGDYHWQMTTVLTVLAILTMTVGNVLALWQDNVRRLLAYSSIAHAGYMLVGLAVGFTSARQAGNSPALDGTGAMLFYLAVYVLATAGTFASLTYLGGKGQPIDGVDELAGLGRTHSIPALAIAAFMFSLAGIPPLAGFWGKFNILASAFGFGLSRGGAPGPEQVWFLALATIGVLNAAVAAAYYLRIVTVMYFRAPLATARAEGGGGAWLAAVACAALVVGIGCMPGPLVDQSHEAGQAAR
ncbi:MAG TPA: NADH-quinone oxidoreductase subunit N, partial [Pirellulales bacterium]|nr:NADH-quinone oxidoreductase subunit N [Pirellulales bacterium]